MELFGQIYLHTIRSFKPLLTFPSFAVPSVVLPFTPILHVLSHDPLSDSFAPLSNFYRAMEESLWLGCRVAGSGSG